MFGKLKRFTSLFLTTALVLLTFAPSAVSASQAASAEAAVSALIKESDAALYSVRGAQVPSQLSQGLTKYNITINDNTLIEILPSNDADSAAVLHVTNAVGTQIQKAIVMSVNEEGKLQSFPIPDSNSASTRAGNSGDSGTVYPFSDSFNIVFIINFDAYSNSIYNDAYVRPHLVMAMYYDENNLYDITRLKADYCAYGTEYTYPGFVAVAGALDTYTHHVTINQTNPNPRTNYNKSNPYRSDRVILVRTSELGAHYIDWTLEGVRNSNNRSFSIWDTIQF